MGLSSRSMNTRLHPNVFQVISQAERLNIDASRVSIGGLSAGGHMSAVLSHMARDEGLELRLALMIVPSTDFRWLIAPEPIRSEIAERYSSTVLYKDAPWGGLKREQWFLDYWIPTGKSNMRIVCWSLC
jgi:acetyl esterase/lipase